MTDRHTLYIEAGDTEVRIFDYDDNLGAPINTTGYTATLEAIVGPTTLSLSVGSGIIMSGVDGRFTVTLTPSQTQSLKDAGNLGKYRLRVTSPTGVKTTLAQGALVCQ